VTITRLMDALQWSLTLSMQVQLANTRRAGDLLNSCEVDSSTMTAWRAGTAILLAIRLVGRLFFQREAFLNQAYRALLQLRVLLFRPLQDGNVGVGGTASQALR
jgi:hypothetical protein